MTKITLEQVKQLGNGKIITYSGEEALYQVKKYGIALQYVRNQTPEICLAAVKENGDVLRYVDERCFESDTKRL